METLALQLILLQLLLLLLLRPLLLWYLKLSRIARTLESIDQSLKCLPAVKSERRAELGIKTRAA